ncbi:MAG: DUF3768 domain-containing protein [Alphaproteobacteria bacterium]
MTDQQTTERIRALNDAFRTTMSGGRVMLTRGVDALEPDVKSIVLRRVATFDAFSEDNDPYHEHDFGSFEVTGRKIFWKIDHYDKALVYGSEEPANPVVTTRVLTIMLAEEY